MDLRQAATEAEADRLFGLFLRIRVLAQTRSLEFLQAGEEAVRNGLVTAEDWALIKQA
jgi:hypothetical protein